MPVTQVSSIEEIFYVETSAFVDQVYPADGNITVAENITEIVEVKTETSEKEFAAGRTILFIMLTCLFTLLAIGFFCDSRNEGPEPMERISEKSTHEFGNREDYMNDFINKTE